MLRLERSIIYSIEKATDMLLTLVDLKKDQSLELPETISGRVTELLLAQQDLMLEIKKYLVQENNYRNENDTKTITAIVQTCPEFLSIRDRNGQLPCHVAAKKASSTVHKQLLSFVDVGCQHNIWPDDRRGGLLQNDRFRLNALHYIKDPKVFDILRKHDPPLFYIEDVQKYDLLHHATETHSLGLIKYFYNLDPSCLCQIDYDDNLPIHHAVRRREDGHKEEIIRYVLQQSVSHSVLNETVGGLFTIVPYSLENRLAIEVIVMSYGREGAWDCIERALSASPHLEKLPLLHQIIKHIPRYCTDVINRFPSSIFVRDSNNNNRLPIHVALEGGMKISTELTCLLVACQKQLAEVDPVTKWPPFVLAAMETSCDMVTIYRLLQKNPEHVETWCNCSVKRKHVRVENCKRRKISEVL